MKKHIILVIFLLMAIGAFAYTPMPADTIKRVVTEKTIVRDSTGKVYAYDEWRKLTTGGKFFLRAKTPTKDGKPNMDPNMEYILTPASAAQKITTRSYTTTIKRNINENTIVKDSAGQQYPYSIWHKMQLSGNYTLRPKEPMKNGKPNEDPDMEYILVPFSAQQRADVKKRMGPPRESPYFITGQSLKPFKVTDITGKDIEEKDWAGKTVVLNFWYAKSDLSAQMIPELSRIADKYANNPNVLFIAVTFNKPYDVEQFITKTPFNYHLVADGQLIMQRLGIKTFPVNVVIDKQGKVIFHTGVYALNVTDWIEKTIAESDSAKAAQ